MFFANIIHVSKIDTAKYERYRADDARLIGELRADRKRIESIVAMQQQTIRELQLPVEPVIIVRESNTVDTVRQVSGKRYCIWYCETRKPLIISGFLCSPRGSNPGPQH